MSRAYQLKSETDMALVLVQGVVRENRQYLPAMMEYAKLTYDLNDLQASEAAIILLTCLVQKRGQRSLGDSMLVSNVSDRRFEIAVLWRWLRFRNEACTISMAIYFATHYSASIVYILLSFVSDDKYRQRLLTEMCQKPNGLKYLLK